jgi:hypothetical protein
MFFALPLSETVASHAMIVKFISGLTLYAETVIFVTCLPHPA